MNVKSFDPMPPPDHSPWGKVDQARYVAPGIWWVATASHGGFIISQQRYDAMPEPYKRHVPWSLRASVGPIAGPVGYEEDCDWCVVVLAWPELFGSDDIKQARQTFDAWIAPKLAPKGWLFAETATGDA